MLPQSTSSPSVSPVASYSSGYEVKTSYNQQGFPTTVTIYPVSITEPQSFSVSGSETMPPFLPTGPGNGNIDGPGNPSTKVLTTLQHSVLGSSTFAATMSTIAATHTPTPQAPESSGPTSNYINDFLLALVALASIMLML